MPDLENDANGTLSKNNFSVEINSVEINLKNLIPRQTQRVFDDLAVRF
jgi:hypothetical protein